VRDEYSYDRFFGYRDVYLLTETKDVIDRRLLTERWIFHSDSGKADLAVSQIAIVLGSCCG